MPLRTAPRKSSLSPRLTGPSRFALQITLIICLKLTILFGIWYAFIREHKVPHDIPATTRHILS